MADNPPFGIQPKEIAHQPDQAHEFFGGRGPCIPLYLPPSVVALRIFKRIITTVAKKPWDEWWIPSVPWPTLQVKLSQGPPCLPR